MADGPMRYDQFVRVLLDIVRIREWPTGLADQAPTGAAVSAEDDVMG